MVYIDTNILIYYFNKLDGHHYSARKIFGEYFLAGELCFNQIVLYEFFSIITDTRKVENPWLAAEASSYIKKIAANAPVHTVGNEIFADAWENIDKYNVSRYGIYDHLIAFSMKHYAIDTIITANKRDFEKYEFINNIIVPEKSENEDENEDNKEILKNTFIPYGKQSVNREDIAAVTEVLRSDFITQGPKVAAFEQGMADYTGANYAVAVNSATSALHIAYQALGLGPGDELWSSPITFVATTNAALYCGADVDFVEVEEDTGNISMHALAAKLQERKAAGGKLPKIVAPVHLGGLSCDMKAIAALARQYGFRVVEDASHAIGGSYQNYKVGSCAYSDITVFSFHPVKVMTTGEGGMALTNDQGLADRMGRLRSHGVTRDPALMNQTPHGGWYYQQIELGYNYRMTDIQASLGLAQLERLDEFVSRRNDLAQRYDELLVDLPLKLPGRRQGIYSAFHLYAVRLDTDQSPISRKELFDRLREAKIGVQIHYIPVHTQPYYQSLGFAGRSWPLAEAYYEQVLSLPLYFSLTDQAQERVVGELRRILQK